ncbi:MAG: glycosyltransferase family 39 protein [Nitrospinota bacterium]
MRKKQMTFAALGIILLAALFMRTYRLSERGMISTDEGAYYNVGGFSAAYLRSLASERHAADSSTLRRQTLKDYFARERVRPAGPIGTKPVYTFLLTIFFLLTTPTPFHFLLVNAILGTLTVLLIYRLAYRMTKNSSYAVLAALSLALSGFHVIWSRSGFPHTSGTFFLTLGWLLYARGVWNDEKPRALRLFMSGLAQGAAFSTHPASGPYLGVCLVTEIYRMFRGQEMRRGICNLILIGVGMILIPLLVEGISWILERGLLPGGRWVFGSQQSHFYHFNLLRQGSGVLDYSSITSGWRLSGLVWMPFLYGEGAVYTGLAVVGWVFTWVFLFQEKREQDFFLLVAIMLPLAFYAISNTMPFARNLAFLTPLSALLVARTLERCWNRIRKQARRFSVISLFVFLQIWHSAYLFEVQSGYARAVSWLAKHGDNRILLSNLHSLWYPHGVTIYEFKRIENDGRIAAVEWPLNRPVLISTDDRPLFAGFVKFRDGQLPKEFTTLLDTGTEVIRFPNGRAFTVKKTELIGFARRVAQISPFNGVNRWLEAHLARERDVVDAGSVSLYQVKTSPPKPPG